MRLQIGVLGDSSPTEEGRRLAYEVGYYIAEIGAILVCGGLGGIMEESARGAKEKGGITVGIIPGVEHRDANPYLDIVIPTGFDQGRNILIVRAAHAAIAIEGGFGTLSEIAFACKLKVPLVGLRTWQFPNLNIVIKSTAKEAVEWAKEAALARFKESHL
jgi:uncharacterized protein (TIGR00725 family)